MMIDKVQSTAKKQLRFQENIQSPCRTSYKSILKNSSAKKPRTPCSRSSSKKRNSVKKVAYKIKNILHDQRIKRSDKVFDIESQDSDSDNDFEYAERIEKVTQRDQMLPKW